MKFRHDKLAAVLVALCVAQQAVAQIERQAETYELTLDECLAQTFANNPEIRRLRLDVERAAGTKLVFTARALP